MSSSEALTHLSALRLGVCLDMFHEVGLERIQGLMVAMRPAHLQYDAGSDLSASRRDEVRAELLRGSLLDN